MRQQLHKQRQSGARTAVATRQARQQAAEAIAQRSNLAADHAVSDSLAPASRSEGDGKLEREENRNLEAPVQGDLNSESDDAPSPKRLRSLAVPFLTLPFFLKFVTIWQLVMVFLRVGSVTFGGGFVMIPQIETDVVNVHGWLTRQAFADSVVFGQITPPCSIGYFHRI
jgi:hypothetical protein